MASKTDGDGCHGFTGTGDTSRVWVAAGGWPLRPVGWSGACLAPTLFLGAAFGVEPSEGRFGRVVDERHRLRHGMMAGDLSDGCVHALTHPTVRLVALGLVRSSSMWIASRALNCIE